MTSNNQLLLAELESDLGNDLRFHYYGKAVCRFYKTYAKDESEGNGFINLNKNLAKKGYGAFEIQIWDGSAADGVGMKIKMYVPSYCEWDTMFEGFIESMDDFKAIKRMLGL